MRRGRLSFDVLVIGSGASGLAAAVSADRAGAKVRDRDQGLAPVLQLGEGAGRDPGVVRRGRLARERAEDVWKSSHETARPAARRGADRRRAERDPLARGARRRVHPRQRRLPARPAAAARPQKRLLQVGDRTGHAITKGLREAVRARASPCSPTRRSPSSSRAGARGRRARGRRGRGRPRRRRAAATGRPRSAASSPRTIPARPARSPRSRSASAPRRATWTRSSTTRTAAPGRRTCRATRSPRRRAPTAPSSLNTHGEEFTDSLGPRDAVSQAIFDEVEKGNGVETPDGRPAVLLDTTRIPEADADVSLPYMLRRYRARRNRPPDASRSTPTLSSTTRTAAS